MDSAQFVMLLARLDRLSAAIEASNVNTAKVTEAAVMVSAAVADMLDDGQDEDPEADDEPQAVDMAGRPIRSS